MPFIKHMDVVKAYNQYVRITNKLPEEVRQSMALSFSSYVGIPAHPQHIAGSHTLRAVPSKGLQRVEQLLGPNGEALFRAWVIKQCEKSE